MKLPREGPILTSTCDLYYLINGSANWGTGVMLYNPNLSRNSFTNSASSGRRCHIIHTRIACASHISLLGKLRDWTKTAHPGAAVRPLPDFLFFINGVSHFRSPTGIRCNFPQGLLVPGGPRQNWTELQDTDQRIELPLLAKGTSPCI